MQGRVLETIDLLMTNPHDPSLHTKKLKGRDDWAAHVDGANRVTFLWQGDLMTFLNHCHHSIVE